MSSGDIPPGGFGFGPRSRSTSANSSSSSARSTAFAQDARDSSLFSANPGQSQPQGDIFLSNTNSSASVSHASAASSAVAMPQAYKKDAFAPTNFGHFDTEVQLAISPTFVVPPVIINPDSKSTYLRSEIMSYIQLYVPPDIAVPTIGALGDLGAVHFIDLNAKKHAFQLSYIDDVRRLDEMLRRLKSLSIECARLSLPMSPRSRETVVQHYSVKRRMLDDLASRLSDLESRVGQMNKSISTFNRVLCQLIELHHVLMRSSKFFAEQTGAHFPSTESISISPSYDDQGLLNRPFDPEIAVGAIGDATQLSFVAGVISRDKTVLFDRLLMRALRGNALINTFEIPEYIVCPNTEELAKKDIFIIFANGVEVMRKIHLLTKSMGGVIYPVHANPEQRLAELKDTENRIADIRNVLANTIASKRADLVDVADRMNDWFDIVIKEKAVYQTLNMFKSDGVRHSLIAEGWCPTEAIPRLQQVLLEAKEAARSMIPSVLNVLPLDGHHPSTRRKVPPTYIKETPFTMGFQAIIDAYGVAKYRELNPAIFACISFPFLFAVMFGDFGHGIIVTLAAIYLCMRGHNFTGVKMGAELPTMIYGGRYLILLMGVFSIYTGLIYNDAFSKMTSLFSSRWKYTNSNVADLIPDRRTYPFGIDWGWHDADNRLLFLNNYKMKLSIIFGVLQMSFGTLLSLFNQLHFKSMRNIICDFVPQMLFMQSIFGYLVVMIITKWCIQWDLKNPSEIPSLLNALIFMFLDPTKSDDKLFKGQSRVQQVLLAIALISVPWMLFLKPYLAWKDNKRMVGYSAVDRTSISPAESPVIAPIGELPGSENHAYVTQATAAAAAAAAAAAGATTKASVPAAADDNLSVSAESHGSSDASDHDGHGEFQLSDHIIHQVIHTVEYCLGCISNTASYLRLWALSLAHAQLSEVIWDMPFKMLLEQTGSPMFPFFGGLVIFPFWFFGTIAVLICMEGMSAFLHALRLHWVEFDGKFYEGSGYKFMPFSLERVRKDHQMEQMKMLAQVSSTVPSPPSSDS